MAGKERFMEKKDLISLFPQIAQQFRYALSNLHMASAMLAPVEEREQDEELDHRAALLDRSFYQMMRLVNQLTAAVYLTESRPLTLKNRDLSAVLNELCAQVESLAYYKGLKLRFEQEPGVFLCAVAPEELEQLFYNLISNAFKFTPVGGSVTVSLRSSGDRFLISVADTGCGIAVERMEHIFESYAHYDPMTPPPHGLGLGLALCHHFATGMGGTLLAESVPGEGSVFTLSLSRRTVAGGVHDVSPDYSGGFNLSLMGLADALPAKAYRVREQD